MKSLYATSLRICREMGAYGADWYIASVISKFTKMADDSDNYLGIWDVSSAEKLYFAKALRNIKISPTSSDAPAVMLVSDKITKIIDAILEEHSTFQGIIFVQTRAA